VDLDFGGREIINRWGISNFKGKCVNIEANLAINWLTHKKHEC